MSRPLIGTANTFPPLTCERLEDRSLLSVSATDAAFFAVDGSVEVIPCVELPGEAVRSDDGNAAMLPADEIFLDDTWLPEEEYWDDSWLPEEEFWDDTWVPEDEFWDDSWYDDAWLPEEEFYDDSWYDDSWMSEEEYYDDTWYDDSWLPEEEFYDDSSYDDSWLPEEEYWDDTWFDDSWTREVIYVDDSWSPDSNWIWQCGTPDLADFSDDAGDEPLMDASSVGQGIPVPALFEMAATADPIAATPDPVEALPAQHSPVAGTAGWLPPETNPNRLIAAPEVVAAPVEEVEAMPSANMLAAAQPAAEATGLTFGAPAASDDHLAGAESLELSEDLPVG